MTRRRKSILIVAVVLAAVAVVAALRPPPVAVDLATTTRGPFQVRIEDEGQTRAREVYAITAPVTGTLERIALDPGDRIEEGAVVARLVPAQPALIDPRYRAELEARADAAAAAVSQAEAGLTRARATAAYSARELELTRELFRKGAVARRQLDAAELDAQVRSQELRAAEFAVRTARYEAQAIQSVLSGARSPGQLEQIELRSPITGIVLTVRQTSAGVVAAGTLLLELAAPSALEIVVDVLTTDAVRIRAGAPVLLDRWGGESTLHGRVRRVDPAGYTKVSALGVEEQRVNVIIDLTDAHEKWRTLGLGYRVEAGIVVYQADEALQIPLTALFRADGEWAVFVASGGRAHRRRVVVGQRSELAAQVLSGLEPGDMVVLHPGDAIRDGVRIAPRERP